MKRLSEQRKVGQLNPEVRVMELRTHADVKTGEKLLVSDEDVIIEHQRQ